MKKFIGILAASVLSLSAFMFVLTSQAFAAGPFTCTWTGATDNNFSTAGNWSGCNSAAPQPADHDNLIFDNTSLSNTAFINDDISGLTVTSIHFIGSNTTYADTINSTNNYTITITGGIIDTTTDGYTQIDTSLIISGNQTFSTAMQTDFTTLQGSGNVNVTGGGTANFYNDAFTGALNNYSGTISSTDSVIELGAFSDTNTTSNGSIAVSGNATLDLFNNDGGGKTNASFQLTYSIPMSIGGNGVGKWGALNLDGSQGSNTKNTLAAAVTLTSDVQVTATGDNTLNITGPINYNGHSISSIGQNVTTITVASGSNLASETPGIGSNVTYVLDGTVGNTTVNSGGILMGSGTTSNLTVQSGGTVAPGHSPGCMTVSGNYTQSGAYQAQLGGTTACTGYDQLIVTGNVTLSGVLSLSLVNGFTSKTGQTFEIINNQGTQAVSGTFAGQTEGSTLTVNGHVFTISYKGGDGNDVVLTAAPSAPNTGFGVASDHPLRTFVECVFVAAALGALALTTRKFAKS